MMPLQDGNQPSISQKTMPMTIRELFMVIATTVSIITAWALYGTRVSIIEDRIVAIQTTIVEVKQTLKDIETRSVGTSNQNRNEMIEIEIRLRRIEEQQARLDGILRRQHSQ